MADWLSREQRSHNMASIRSKGNATTEGAFLQLLRKATLSGWRRHVNLPGKPDFTFREEGLAVFIDGCFWHGCPKCRRPLPQANQTYWVGKLKSNIVRARRVTRELHRAGITTVRIWEHELRSWDALEKLLNRLSIYSC